MLQGAEDYLTKTAPEDDGLAAGEQVQVSLTDGRQHEDTEVQRVERGATLDFGIEELAVHEQTDQDESHGSELVVAEPVNDGAWQARYSR